MKRSFIRMSFASLSLIITLLIAIAAPALAIAPPQSPSVRIPAHVLAQRSDPRLNGQMIAPVRPVFPGPFYAAGNAIGNALLQDYIKTNASIKLLIIPVQFTDKAFNPANQAALTALANNIKQYFLDQSGGKLTITPEFTFQSTVPVPQPYTLAHTEAYYGATDNVRALIEDAVAAADSNVNFSTYQCLMVMHAGYGDETSGVDGGSNDIWSMYYWRDPQIVSTNDGVTVKGATIVPEMEHGTTNALGTVCHEFGHQLGLPDFYDTTYDTEGGVGYWSLMASGNYNGSPAGSKPAPLDPWCRFNLGWITPTGVTENQDNFNFETGKTYRFEKGGGSSGTDYFFAEKRGGTISTWDQGLPGEGLLVFHVDSTKASSSTPNDTPAGTPNGDVRIARLLEVMTANGGNHLFVKPRSHIRGLSTDPYPTATVISFNNSTSPSSKTWPPASANSFIGINNIVKTGSGSSMVVTANVIVKPVITKIAGDSQTAAANTPFTTKLKIYLGDSAGPVAANAVTFSVTGGSALITEAQPVQTNAQGNAEITLIAGSTQGPVTVSATATVTGSGLPAVTTVFNETVSGGQPAGPAFQSAAYQDTNANSTVDAGDSIVLTFSKQIVIGAIAASDFVLPVTGDSLGASPTFAAGTQNTQLAIILGTNPKITPVGIFSAAITGAGSPSGINLIASLPAGHITDTGGANATAAAAAVDIAGGGQPQGPIPQSASWTDSNSSGTADAGDKVTITFDKQIALNAVASSDLALPVTGDSLGTAPGFSHGAANTQLEITLGAGCKITPNGAFNATSLGAGSPSGINVSASITAGHITDTGGANAVPAAVALDVSGTTSAQGPTPVSATWQDLNANGSADAGDRISMLFDKPITVSGVTASDLTLPVTGDSLGTGPTFAAGTQPIELWINLGASAKITPAGTFNSGTLAFGSPSGINISQTIVNGHITDSGGNNARPASQALDIGASVEIGDVSTANSTAILANSNEQPFLADGVDTAAVEVTIRDDASRAIPNCDVYIKSDRNQYANIDIFTPASPSKTNSSGKVTFVIKTTQTGVRSITVEAQKTGFAKKTIGIALQIEFKAGPVSPVLSVITATRTQLIADGIDSAEISVNLRDANNNPAAQKMVSLKPEPAAGVTITPASILTDSGGNAKFVIRSTQASNNVAVSAVAEGGITLNQVVNFSFTSPVVSPTLSTVEPATPGAYYTANGQVAAQIIITIRNASGQPIAGVVPTVTVTGSNNSVKNSAGQAMPPAALVATDSEGRTSLQITSTLAEQKTVTAVANGVTLSQRPILLFVPGPYKTLQYISGNNQIGIAGQPLPLPLKVRLIDEFGNGVPAQSVRFAFVSVPAGTAGHALTDASPATDINGYSTAKVTFGNVIGQYKVSADIQNAEGAPVVFNLEAKGGPPRSMRIAEGSNQNGPINMPLNNPLAVNVYDAANNTLENVIVHFAQKLGSDGKPDGATDAVLSQSDVITDGAGFARVSVLKLGDRVGTYRIVASVSADPPVTPVEFVLNAMAGNPAQMTKVSGDAQSASAGLRAADPFKVKVLDASGNSVSNCVVSFFVYRGIGTLDTESVYTTALGEASVGYVAGRTAGVEEIWAAVQGNYTVVGSPVRFSLTVVPGPAAKIAVGGYSNVISGDAGNETTTPFAARVTDSYGNPVNNTLVTYTITATPAGAAGQSIVRTDPAGSRSDADGQVRAYLKFGSKVGTYEIEAASAGLVGSPVKLYGVASTGTVSSTASTVTVSRNNVLADGIQQAELTIRCVDIYGNAVSGARVIVGTTPSVQSVTYISPYTDNDGYVRAFIKSTKSGVFTLSVNARGVDLSNPPTVTFTSGPVNASKSSFYLNNPSAKIMANNSDSFLATIQLKDASLNAVSGIAAGSVAIYSDDDPLYTTVVSPSAASDAEGKMYFSVRSKRSGAKQISVFVNGQRIQTIDKKDTLEFPFAVNVMDPQRSSIEFGTSSTIAGQTVNIKVSPKGTNQTMIEDLERGSFNLRLWNVRTASFDVVDIVPASTFIGQDKSYNFTLLNKKAGLFEIVAELDQNGYKTSFVQRPAITYSAAGASRIAAVNPANIYSEITKNAPVLLEAKVTDEFDNPVRSAQVLFQAVGMPSGSQNTAIGSNSTFTNDDGMATTSIKIGTKTGLYSFRAVAYDSNSSQLSGSPVTYNAYGTPGAAAKIVVNNAPQTVTQYQAIGQLEVVVYDAFDNVKSDSTDRIYFTSTDPLAELPYGSAQKVYTMTAADQGRKVFSADPFFLVSESSATTITAWLVNSQNQLFQTTTGAVRVNKISQEQAANFTIGSFVMPGSFNYIVFTAKSKSVLASAPSLVVAFDSGSSNRYTMVAAPRQKTYYRIVRVGSLPFRAAVKVVGDGAYGEATIEY